MLKPLIQLRSIFQEDAEGFIYKDNKNFCYYSRGSEEFTLLNERLDTYFKLMFGYINSIGSKDE